MRNKSKMISDTVPILEGQASRQMIGLVKPDPVLLFGETFTNALPFCDSTGKCVQYQK
jgi:hypothetical protein